MEKILAEDFANQFIKITWGKNLDRSLIDDSCKDYVKSRIWFFLIFHNVENKNIQNINELNDELLSTFQEINTDVKKKYLEFYSTYGGKNALFALCMQRALEKQPSEPYGLAMLNFLTWYHEKREIDLKFLRGGHVAAAWPFEWFLQNFNNIASSVIGAAIMIIASKSYTKVIDEFYDTFYKIKNKFTPYPDELLQLKPKNKNIKEFKNFLKNMDCYDNYLYIFEADEKILKEVIKKWIDEVKILLNNLTEDEIEILKILMKKPISLPLGHSLKYLNTLRAKGLIRFIEKSPQDIFAVFYPNEIDIEFRHHPS